MADNNQGNDSYIQVVAEIMHGGREASVGMHRER